MTTQQKVSMLRTALRSARASHALLRLNNLDLARDVQPEVQACVELLSSSLEAAINAVDIMSDLLADGQLEIMDGDMFASSKRKGVACESGESK